MHNRYCPHCKWRPLEFTGTFYTLESGKIEYNLSINDIIEVYGHAEDNIPDTHYPKISNISKYGWDEIHMCPNCKKEFKILN